MKGYINIKLGGVSRGLKFGNRAFLDIMAEYDLSLGLKFSFEVMVCVVYHGLLNNCAIKKEDPDFTREDVELWVDDIGIGKLTAVFEAFKDSFTVEPDESSAPAKKKRLPVKK